MASAGTAVVAMSGPDVLTAVSTTTTSSASVRTGRAAARSVGVSGGTRRSCQDRRYSFLSRSCALLASFSIVPGSSVVPNSRESGWVGGGISAVVVGPSW